jgi:hypothetical protein
MRQRARASASHGVDGIGWLYFSQRYTKIRRVDTEVTVGARGASGLAPREIASQSCDLELVLCAAAATHSRKLALL